MPSSPEEPCRVLGPGSPEDALRRLEQRLDQASAAAERLMAQAAGDESRGSTSELDPLVALVQAVRDLIPPDLQQRLIVALREMLLALRALIDWYLERLDSRREQGVEVQDIPIL